VCDAFPREPFIALNDREMAAMREELLKAGFLQ
jgi:hypothetical protein